MREKWFKREDEEEEEGEKREVSKVPEPIFKILKYK